MAACSSFKYWYFHILVKASWIFRYQFMLNNANSAIFVVVFVAIWKTFGISTIILVAAIQNISESLYEASAIDGQGKLNDFPCYWALCRILICP